MKLTDGSLDVIEGGRRNVGGREERRKLEGLNISSAPLDCLRLSLPRLGRCHGRGDDVTLAEARLDVLRTADALEAAVDHDGQAGAECLAFLWVAAPRNGVVAKGNRIAIEIRGGYVCVHERLVREYVTLTVTESQAAAENNVTAG